MTNDSRATIDKAWTQEENQTLERIGPDPGYGSWRAKKAAFESELPGSIRSTKALEQHFREMVRTKLIEPHLQYSERGERYSLGPRNDSRDVHSRDFDTCSSRNKTRKIGINSPEPEEYSSSEHLSVGSKEEDCNGPGHMERDRSGAEGMSSADNGIFTIEMDNLVGEVGEDVEAIKRARKQDKRASENLPPKVAFDNPRK